jgi:tRNA(fMet)-specific endonuclease VapC
LTPAVVVDTDVISFIFKRDTRSAYYLPLLTGKIAVISFMTLAELRQWAERRNWGPARRARLEQFVTGFAILHSTDQLCSEWTRITSSSYRSGYSIGVADAWIAATASMLSLPLVTNNGSDYAGVPSLEIISQP